ncbi:MAG TPA: hypothetical protein PKI03_29490 [Pseudomonadota bacterium]|nr:hypothetical protein [Pseudomonadota bacterium]
MSSEVQGARRGRAVVLGGSMAGLTAARVLADYFDEVLLVERDPLSDSDEPRKGVPQGRQLHVLLRGGELQFERLFPGLTASLLARGALQLDASGDFLWHHFGVDKVRFTCGVTVTMMTRPFFEQEVRRRVVSLPNVKVYDQRDALGFLASPDGKGIVGVKLRQRGAGEESEASEEIPAELVVDACGRGSATPRWLSGLGLSSPPETKIRVDVAYATRFFRPPAPEHLPPYRSVYIVGTPPHGKRLGIITPVEGGRWMALVAGMLGDPPPTDPDGFLAFCQGLPIPEMHRLLSLAEPISDIYSYKFPAHLRRHYDRMPDFPDGLVVLGDSHCSFNPIYGQGMTVAALGAVELGACLSEQRQRGAGSLRGLSRRFQARLAKAADTPWMMATGEDLRFPEVEAKRPFGYAGMKFFLGRLHQAVAHDRVLALNFLRVLHMLEPPTKLFEPQLLWRVLAGGIAT